MHGDLSDKCRDTFEKNYRIKLTFAKSLKEVDELSEGLLGATGFNWLNRSFREFLKDCLFTKGNFGRECRHIKIFEEESDVCSLDIFP